MVFFTLLSVVVSCSCRTAVLGLAAAAVIYNGEFRRNSPKYQELQGVRCYVDESNGYVGESYEKGVLAVPDQNYANHRQVVPLFHYVLMPVLLLTVIGASVNLYESWGDHERVYSASLLLVLAICVTLAALCARLFATKVQDRAIRAEENLRHFALTGKLLDPRLTPQQIVGLRFAQDTEFVNLARRAAEDGMSGDAIKKSVQSWRAD